MTVRTSILATSLIGAAFFVSAPAHADSIWVFAPTPGHTNSDPNGVFVFNSGAGNGSPGVSQAYTASGGPSITASGFNTSGATVGLWEKNGGGDENGLGLVNDPSGDHEITQNNFIQFDLNNLSGGLLQLSFKAGSTTGGETWNAYVTSTAGSLTGATLLDSCTSGGSRNCEAINFYSGVVGNASDRYLDITVGASGQNVLVSELDTHAVPGPIAGAGLPGLIAACGGLLALARRRRQLVV